MAQVNQQGQSLNPTPYVLDGVTYDNWNEYIKARYDVFINLHDKKLENLHPHFVQDLLTSSKEVKPNLSEIKENSIFENVIDSNFEKKDGYIEIILKEDRHTKNIYRFDGHKVSYKPNENQDRSLNKKRAEQMVSLAIEAGIDPMKFSECTPKEEKLLKAAEKKIKNPQAQRSIKIPGLPKISKKSALIIAGAALVLTASIFSIKSLMSNSDQSDQSINKKDKLETIYSDTKTESLFTKGERSEEIKKEKPVAAKKAPVKKSAKKKQVTKKTESVQKTNQTKQWSDAVAEKNKKEQQKVKPRKKTKEELAKQIEFAKASDPNLQELYAQRVLLEVKLEPFLQLEEELNFYQSLYNASNIAKRLKENGGATHPFFDLDKVFKNPLEILNHPIHVRRSEAMGGIFVLFDLVKQIPQEEANAAGISKTHFQRLDDAVWDNGKKGIAANGFVPSLKRIQKFKQKREQKRDGAAEKRFKGRNVNGRNGTDYGSKIRSEEMALQDYVHNLIMGGSPEGKLFRRSHLNDLYRTFDLAAEKTWNLRKITRSKNFKSNKKQIKIDLKSVDREIKSAERKIERENKYGAINDIDIDQKTDLGFNENKTELAMTNDVYTSKKDVIKKDVMQDTRGILLDQAKTFKIKRPNFS